MYRMEGRYVLIRKNERLQQQEKLRGNPTVLWMNAAAAPIFAAENKNWTILAVTVSAIKKNCRGLPEIADAVQCRQS